MSEVPILGTRFSAGAIFSDNHGEY
jgi:hypothetical protein